jgi:HSP20 family protein
MALTDLVPSWSRNRAVSTPSFAGGSDPFLALHREMNRMFDDFARGFGVGMPSVFAASTGWPHIEVSETDEALKVVADLPGLEEKDIDISLNNGVLTLKGEKKSETSGATYSERWHGQFQRSLQLGVDVDPERVSAGFKNGVLTITLPKRPEAQSQVRRIPVNQG